MPHDLISFLQQKRVFFEKVQTQALDSFCRADKLFKLTGLRGIKDLSGYLATALSEPCYYIFQAPSKKLRPIFGYLLMKALAQRNTSPYESLLIIPELLHSASLVLDDIEDGALMRRNRPCLHIKFGLDIAVNAANALYFLAFSLCRTPRLSLNEKMRVQDIIIEAMNRMHAGQGLDILWHRSPQARVCPHQYKAMAKLKTSSFFRAEAQLALLFSRGRGKAAEMSLYFAENAGLAFQIMDDVLDLDLKGEEVRNFGKRFAQDITEGKKTLIVAYAMERAASRDKKVLAAILGRRTSDPGEINKAIEIINKYGCLEEARGFAQTLLRDSWKAFSRFLAASREKEYLESYCDFIIERRF